VQKDVIESFSVDAALVPVGGDVQLRCRVTRVDGGSFVQLTKSIPDTDRRQQVLTTNVIKERVIQGIERYSIVADPYGEHGYDFVFTITGSESRRFLARDVIYTSRAYATISVSVCLYVCL